MRLSLDKRAFWSSLKEPACLDGAVLGPMNASPAAGLLFKLLESTGVRLRVVVSTSAVAPICAALLISACALPPASRDASSAEARRPEASIAASYSAEQMAQRLKELAENPLPTQSELSSEFGIQWRTLVHPFGATGRVLTDYQAIEVLKPLRLHGPVTPNSSSVALRDWGIEKSLSLTFDVRALCVNNYALEGTFSRSPWVVRRFENLLKDHPATVLHESVQQGQFVHVDTRGTGCLESITITRYALGFKPKFLGEE